MNGPWRMRNTNWMVSFANRHENLRRAEMLNFPRHIKYVGPPGFPNSPVDIAQIHFQTSYNSKKFTTNGGVLAHNNNEVFIAVDGLTAEAVSNASSLVMLVRTGANTWEIQNAVDPPTDKLWKKLATVTTNASGYITELILWWQGGDIDWAECFPVTVVDDGGAADPPTYTVTTSPGGVSPVTLIATGGVPTNYRDSALSYIAGSKGYAKILGDGSFEFFVDDEYEDHETKCVAIVTGSDEGDPPCYTITPTQYSLTKLKSPASCP